MPITDQPTKGMYLSMEGKYFYIIDRQLKTQGRQGGLVILKLKNLTNGTTIVKTIKAGSKVEQVIPEMKEVQYLYADATDVYFMETTTFENISIPKDVIGDYIQFLKEGEKVLVQIIEEKVIGLRENPSVELLVTESVDAVKGNTSSSATKIITLETGYKVNVPLFIKEGDVVTINTESGEYTGRVN